MYYIYICLMFIANFTTQRNLGKRWRTIQLLSDGRDLAQTEIRGGGGGLNLILPHPNFAFFGCPNEVK